MSQEVMKRRGYDIQFRYNLCNIYVNSRKFTEKTANEIQEKTGLCIWQQRNNLTFYNPDDWTVIDGYLQCVNFDKPISMPFNLPNDFCIKGINTKRLDLTNWDFGNRYSLHNLFKDSSILERLDARYWDLSQTVNLNSAFHGCRALKVLDVSNWDVSNVRKACGAFYGCTSLKELDVSGWNTSKLENCSMMFGYCTSLETLNVSNWNVRKVTNMRGMFKNCRSLTKLDLHLWDTRNVKDTKDMFAGCRWLHTVKLGWHSKNLKAAIEEACPNCEVIIVGFEN